MNEIVYNISKFIELGPTSDFDNLNKIEKYIIHLIKRSVSSKEISQQIYYDVKPIGSIRPIMYNLPKLHKSQVLLRPILLITKSPKHKLVRFLNLLLQLLQHQNSQFQV